MGPPLRICHPWHDHNMLAKMTWLSNTHAEMKKQARGPGEEGKRINEWKGDLCLRSARRRAGGSTGSRGR